MKYEGITTPQELLEWMSNITYGYQGKTKLYKYDDENFNEDWFDEYVFEEPTSLIKT